eukprot:3935926-Pyramimonas_sp.AAC.1
MLSMRRRPGHVAGSARRGRCLTTELDFRCVDQGPGYRLPCGARKMWLQAWFSEKHLRAGIQLAWPAVVK